MKLKPLYNDGRFPEGQTIDREQVYEMYDNISYYDQLEAIHIAAVEQIESNWSRVNESLNTNLIGLSEFELKAREVWYERARARYEAALVQESRKFDIAVLRFEQLVECRA